MADTSYPRAQERHNALIDDLVASAPGMLRNGFWNAVMALADEPDIDLEGLRKRRFLPDAYRIDRENRVIEIHEAVVTHPPKREALLGMGMFWFDWDAGGWGDQIWDVKLFLHRPDTITPSEVCLTYWYWENVKIAALDMRALSTPHAGRLA